MADIEQKPPFLAKFERPESPCQIVQLAERRRIGNAQSMPFLVQGYVDDHTLSATAETAKVAFAKRSIWRLYPIRPPGCRNAAKCRQSRSPAQIQHDVP